MTYEDPKPMPIAVIGLGCRFPDDVTNSEKLWDMLVQKRSARREAPPNRFNADAFYHPDAEHYGAVSNPITISIRWIILDVLQTKRSS